MSTRKITSFRLAIPCTYNSSRGPLPHRYLASAVEAETESCFLLNQVLENRWSTWPTYHSLVPCRSRRRHNRCQRTLPVFLRPYHWAPVFDHSWSSDTSKFSTRRNISPSWDAAEIYTQIISRIGDIQVVLLQQCSLGTRLICEMAEHALPDHHLSCFSTPPPLG